MARPITHSHNPRKQTYVLLPEDIKEEIKAIAKKEHWSFNIVILEAAKLLIAKHKEQS